MTTANVALLGAIIAAVIALQSFWIKNAIDALADRLHRFEERNHADMQAHTHAIADLRDRVTRLEGKDA